MPDRTRADTRDAIIEAAEALHIIMQRRAGQWFMYSADGSQMYNLGMSDDEAAEQLAAEAKDMQSRAAAAGAALGSKHDNTEPPCIIGEYCHGHGFVHGAEAEELRDQLEALDPDLHPDVRRILDQVDARDSLAWGEVRDKEGDDG